jgi:nickel transport protein
MTIFLFNIITTGSAGAHSINVDVINQTIEIEAYFGDGKPVKNGEVTVYKSNGEVYLTGLTDEDGIFKFDVSDIDTNKLKIEVEQTGHKAEIEVSLGGSIKSSVDDELPLYQRTLAGLGYLLGIGGLASLYLAWRTKRSIEQPQSLNSSGINNSENNKSRKNDNKTKNR